MSKLLDVCIRELLRVNVSLDPEARVVVNDVIFPVIVLSVAVVDDKVTEPVSTPYNKPFEKVMPFTALKVKTVVALIDTADPAEILTLPPESRTIVVEVTVIRTAPPPSYK